MGDKAIDNLWIAKTDYMGGSLATTPYSTVQKDPNNTYNSKNTKTEGTITYVKLWATDPKTNKKVPAGFQRYLKGTIGKYNYFDPNLFEPYYENIKNNPSIYTPDLIALANKKIADTTLSFDGQRNMVIEQPEIDLGADGNRWEWTGLRWAIKKDPKLVDKKMSFQGEGGNPNWQWIERPIALIDSQNSIYSGELDVSNMEGMEESVSGACGENVNVMQNYVTPKLKSPNVSNFNGNDEYHNSVGSWAKGIFQKDTLTQADADKIADPNKTELSAAEMADLYKKSGSKQSFKDWYANRGAGVLSSLSNIILSANTLVGKNTEGKVLEKKIIEETATGKSATDSVTIMGMHPITFGLVALVSLSIIGIVGYKVLNRKA